jgi:hypothetical protein
MLTKTHPFDHIKVIIYNNHLGTVWFKEWMENVWKRLKKDNLPKKYSSSMVIFNKYYVNL